MCQSGRLKAFTLALRRHAGELHTSPAPSPLTRSLSTLGARSVALFSFLCTHSYNHCVGPRGRKEELVKVVVAGFHSQMPGLQGEMMGSMWPTVQAVETAASSFGPTDAMWIRAPFDGWVFLDPVKLNWSL